VSILQETLCVNNSLRSAFWQERQNGIPNALRGGEREVRIFPRFGNVYAGVSRTDGIGREMGQVFPANLESRRRGH